ncbi:MAG: peptide chain release factor 1 [Eubacteriales bacterium]
MLDKLQIIESKYSQIEAQLATSETYDNPSLVAKLNKEQAELAPLVNCFREYLKAKKQGEEAKELLSDPEMGDLAGEELQQSKEDMARLEGELQILLLPKDPNDNKSVIVEIRAGVGGEEAALFAHSLYRMYSMYAADRRWSCEVASLNETELGGVKEISFTIDGVGAYSRFKFESGVHRVQRVPETESGGRVHTSTVTVAVLPEMEEVDVNLNPADVEMQVYRASGAGGQHINKTSSAVRLIHKPTGIVVECQQERSQFQNKDKAMQILASRLYADEQERLASEYSAERRSQVGMGMRNERIRTYNYPQGRVTDHRISLTLYKLDPVLNGAIDELIDPLIANHQAELLKESQ